MASVRGLLGQAFTRIAAYSPLGNVTLLIWYKYGHQPSLQAARQGGNPILER